MEKSILLEGKKTETEILVFKAGGNYYGVKLDTIREILPYDKKPTLIPNAHPLIEGIIMPRDFLIPIIDLVKALKLSDIDDLKSEMLIVTSINNLNIAFHVDSVSGIHRLTNTDLSMHGKKLSTSVKGVVKGIFNWGDKKIELLEFRKIITEINPEVDLGSWE